MTTEYVIRDDAPAPVAVRPIERRKGVTYFFFND